MTSHRFGFTVVELIIVVAIVSIIIGVLVTSFRDYANYQSFQATTAEVTAVLTEVQANAKVALNDEHHGFVIASDRIILFQGITYNPIDPANEVVVFSNVTLTPTFTGGVSEVRLNKVTGIPSATGTIAVTGVQYGATKTITLNDAGVLYYE
jgi:prepilin-type N-terminal cleavage/methylation domain-containing protein